MEGEGENISVGSAQHNARGMFQCAQCTRRFARLDHLSRHVRTHTHERPHQCTSCKKRFARADLLRRHSRRHEDPSERHTDAQPQQGGIRATKACQVCAASKLKCDNTRPCQRCAKRGLSCDEAGDAPTPPGADNRAHGLHDLSSEIHAVETTGSDIHAALQTPGIDILENTAVPNPADDFGYHRARGHRMSNTTDIDPTSAIDFGRAKGHSDDVTAGDFDGSGEQPHVLYSDFLRGLLLTSPQAPFAGLEHSYSSTNAAMFDFWSTNMDAGLECNSTLANVPFGDIPPIPMLEQMHVATPDQTSPGNAQSPEQRAMAVGNGAYATSVWHWVPTSSDSAKAGQADLASSARSHAQMNDTLRLSPEIVSKRLQAVDRDRVLTILLAQCERTHVVRIASSFPSYHVLETLTHVALHFQTVATLPWLHIPTFSPSNVRDELLAALVAYGAFLSPVSANQSLGAAMTDILRHAIGQSFEDNNANTRDPQLWQGFLLTLHLMFWSGSKRTTELAESFTQPLITMLRRSGVMARHHYRQIIPHQNDSPNELEIKWRAWVEEQTKIRIVHHFFLHDAQISMTKFINPLVSPAELTLPLPSSDSLWTASTADEWRSLYSSVPQSSQQTTSMADCVREALDSKPQDRSRNLQPDTSLELLVLYGFWSMVWDCQLLSSWLKTDAWWKDPADLLPFVRSAAICRVLDQLECAKSFLTRTPSTPKDVEKDLVASYLRLALHAPLRCLPCFAGRDGESEAYAVYQMLQEWVQSRDGRKSIWHAGQIYSLARAMPYSPMQGFFAVVVYHASLTLWTFAIVAESRRKRTGTFPSTQGPSDKIFKLDGESSSQLDKFIALGEGTPAISTDHGSEDLILLLYNPAAVMEVGITILRAQARLYDYNLSRFSESLVLLMEGLSNAAKAAGLT